MRILGIDPGLGRMGWGVIEADKKRVLGSGFKAIAYGCIETTKESREEERIELVYEELSDIVKEFSPDVLAIEELFFSKNVTTAFMVGQARGVALLVAAQHKMTIAEYNPGSIKLAVAGYGKADKNQIGQMVKAILKLKVLPKLDDTTDALAIALTHGFSSFKSVKMAKE